MDPAAHAREMARMREEQAKMMSGYPGGFPPSAYPVPPPSFMPPVPGPAPVYV